MLNYHKYTNTPDLTFFQETYIITYSNISIELLHLRHSWFSLGTLHADVVILQLSEDCEITGQNRASEGRIAILQIKHRSSNSAYSSVDVFSPAERNQHWSFMTTYHKLQHHPKKEQNIIIAGNFNCISYMT